MTDLEQSARRIGTTLRDKWTLERLIGVGGMAAVYVALHKIGRRDAIKILHSEVAKSPEVRARFEQEAQAVNRFRHPGAVEIRDIDVTEDGAPFLVMELLEGQTLSKRARQAPELQLDDILRLTDELLDVLAAAHAQGIIHRDIKPDNLFIQTDGRLKVLDFGIARVKKGAEQTLLTRTGTTLGTVAYMSPEQANGGEIDARTDLFAVGATMFRLIAKRRVHEAKSDLEVLKKMASEPAPSLASVCSAPEEICAIVDRALMYDRAQRYPDAATMQADIRAVMRKEAPPYASQKLAQSKAATVPLRRATADTKPLSAVPTLAASLPRTVPRPTPRKPAEPTALGVPAPAPAPASVQGPPPGRASAPTPAPATQVTPPPSATGRPPVGPPTGTAPLEAVAPAPVPATTPMAASPPAVTPSQPAATLVSPQAPANEAGGRASSAPAPASVPPAEPRPDTGGPGPAPSRPSSAVAPTAPDLEFARPFLPPPPPPPMGAPPAAGPPYAPAVAMAAPPRRSGTRLVPLLILGGVFALAVVAVGALGVLFFVRRAATGAAAGSAGPAASAAPAVSRPVVPPTSAAAPPPPVASAAPSAGAARPGPSTRPASVPRGKHKK